MISRHIIRRQVFEFEIPEEKEYPGFAQRISELQSSSFADELDTLLSALVPDDVYLQIDKIELDVGRLDIDDLGGILIKRTLDELEKSLLKMRGSPALARSLQSDPLTRDLRLLAYFVEHARLPWWSPSQGTSIQAVTTRLLHDRLSLLRPLFAQWRHDPLRLRRWLSHVDTHALIPAWKQLYPTLGEISDSDLRRWVDAAIRLISPTIGREASRDAVRYILLSDLLEPITTPSRIPPDPRNPLSLLKKATPFTSLSDMGLRYRSFTRRDDRRREDVRLPAATLERPLPTAAGLPAPAAGRPQEAMPPGGTGLTDRPPHDSEEIAEFRTFLLSGHLMRYRSRSMNTELVRLFRGLVIHQLPVLETTIKDLGRSERIRRRIIDSISSPNIRFFFEKAVPSKKDLIDWVSDVYLETQKKLRPINQTNIRVRRSVDEITLEIYTSTNLNAVTNATFLRMHFQSMALKHHIRYEDLLSKIVESVGMRLMPVSSRFYENLLKVYREDLHPLQETAIPDVPATPFEASEAPPPRPMVEPVPPELLRLLTREVMRALILAKGTGIFGKATRSLQELITAYIRLGKDPPQPDALEAGELRQRIAEYLDLEPDFLAFALQFTARRYPEDAGLRDIATTLSGLADTLESPDRRMTAEEVLALAAHLTTHRVYYEIGQVKSLLLPALRQIRIDRAVFTAVLRLLFDGEAGLVDVTLHRLLDRAGGKSPDSGSVEREEIYRAFISATLDVRNTPFSLNRVFAEVRRRLQPDREEPFVLPTRLSEIKGHAFQDVVKAGADRKGRKGVMTRENAIIRLYNILHLDLLLQEVGARFFDNIPFSFELLLTRYRQSLLDILHAKRLDPELAHFFAYTDPSRLFEQIRALYPRSRVERVSRVFGHAVNLLQRSRWLTLDREQLQAFGLLDSYAHLFARADTELSVSDIVLNILQRAASDRLLSRSFLDLFREPDDDVVLRRLGRRMGQRRLERLLPTMDGLPSSRGDALKKRIQLFRDLLPEAPREASERDAYLSLSAILSLGRFPDGHPFEGQSLESQADYLAQQVVSGRLLARLLAARPPRHATSILLAAVQRPPLVSAILQQFGVDRAAVARTFRHWAARAGDPRLTEEQLMREVLLYRQTREVGRGENALQQSVMAYLVEEGTLSFWQALKSLPREGLPSGEVQALLDAWPRRALEALAGPEPWYEFYFGVLTDPSPSREQDYRAIHAWADYLFRHPAGRTRRRTLTLLVDTYLHAGPGQPGDASPLHLRFLEALLPFDRLPAGAVVRLQRALVSAGVPVAAITTHLAAQGLGTDLPDEGAGDREPPPTPPEKAKLRDIPTPKQLLSALSRTGGTGNRLLAGLRRWVDDRRWSPAEASQLAELLPARAWQALLRSLAPGIEVQGLVDAWVELYRSMGWQPAARQARREVLGVLFSQKLWRYRTPAAIHAALLAAASQPAEGFSVEGLDSRPIAASEEAALTFFLETGMVPGIGLVAASAPEYREMAQQVASKGMARYFSTRQLHPMHEEEVLAFFQPADLSEYIFSALTRQTSDPALQAFLPALSEEAMRSRVRLASLVQFIRLFRQRTAGQPALGNAGVGRLLSDALRISGFETLVAAASEAMPLEAFRRTRNPLLRRVQAERLRKARRPRAALEQAVWFFLRTGMLAPDASFESVDALTAWLHERIRTGDTRIRSLLFQRSREESARQRVRRLIAGLDERSLYNFVHPALFTELSELTRMMRQRFGIDVWRAVGARTDRDRMDRILQWWSRTRYRLDTPLRILQRFMEAVTSVLDERQLARIQRPEPGLLTPAERDLWQELRALIPDWIDSPPEEERKLKPPAASENAEAMNDPEPTPDPADGIPVRNGGLVLLWPFLGRLFSRLQLTDGKNFVGDQELSRAIRITEYIVTGRTDMEEHQLALNKVLCGAPIDFEVPANIDVSTEEADLCGKMLQGVIRNWEKLKTTKPDTFRESFLRREAMLYRIEERWELVVQRKAYDMLLDTLPWNISMIQLSWMPDRLVVQWK